MKITGLEFLHLFDKNKNNNGLIYFNNTCYKVTDIYDQPIYDLKNYNSMWYHLTVGDIYLTLFCDDKLSKTSIIYLNDLILSFNRNEKIDQFLK